MGDDMSSFRVASFSYYLDTAKDNTMLHKISPQQIPILLHNPNKTTLTNLRVDSFSYLNNHGGADYFTQPQLKPGPRSNSTRSGSDAGSYKQKKGINTRRLFLGGFWCHGPCFDKKGVHLSQLVADEPYIGARRQSGRVADNILEEPRNSIEVFGAGATFKGEVARNLERKLSMLTWDAIPKPSTTAAVDDVDAASDASSDLFEIENISGAAHPIITDHIDDAASICMSPASIYAPSEASIQWSVVTASAVDYSAASDCNDDVNIGVGVAGYVLNRKEAPKGRHGGFLGCRSQKAVDVVQNNVAGKNQDRGKHLPTVKS